MKTCIIYGLALAIGLALLSLLFFFLGFHSDVSKFLSTQWISTVASLAVTIACIAFGMKARRDQIDGGESFTYGRALGTGVLIALFATLFGSVSYFLYTNVVNPEFRDVLVQAQLTKLEASGTGGAQLEKAEKMIRVFMHPALQAAMGILMGLFWGTVISLIAAAFLKRPGAGVPASA
jgi:hypothetical protein